MAVNPGYASRAMPGENICGDQCGWWLSGERLVLAVADGLGHGPQAARAASATMTCIGEHLSDTCEHMFAHCDEQLRETRGAALAVAIVEPGSGAMTIGSVGNIRALLLSKTKTLRLDGGRGIVGAGFKNFVTQTLTLSEGDTLALFSDGLDEFPALREMLADMSISLQDHARTILERLARANDDASVLLYRHEIAHREFP